MKYFLVTLRHVVNPTRDIELKTPELSTWQATIEAANLQEAIDIAKNKDNTSLSVWDSSAEEIDVEDPQFEIKITGSGSMGEIQKALYNLMQSIPTTDFDNGSTFEDEILCATVTKIE